MPRIAKQRPRARPSTSGAFWDFSPRLPSRGREQSPTRVDHEAEEEVRIRQRSLSEYYYCIFGPDDGLSTSFISSLLIGQLLSKVSSKYILQ